MSAPTPPRPRIKRQTRVERLRRILGQIFEGEDPDKLLSALNPTEQEWLWQDLSELKKTHSIRYDQSVRMDFLRPPPKMEEFIEDDFYLGRTLRPSEDNVGIYPLWREILVRDFNFGSRIHNCVITGSLGIGKCHRAGDELLRYDGTRVRVEDVRVGELLMGDDSTARVVRSLARGTADLYEIVPVNGDTFCVNGEHILVLVCSSGARAGEIIEVSVTDFLAWPSWKRGCWKLFRVPVDYRERAVRIDPYWLGLWLGDGNSDCPALTSADRELVRYHRAYAKTFGLHANPWRGQNSGQAQVNPASNTSKGKGTVNPLLHLLRGYGLIGQKRIPQDYLVNSRQVRRALLAGLVDSDGYRAQNGCYEFTLANEGLARDIVVLARSLGYRVSFKPKIKKIRRTGFEGRYWYVGISGAHDLPVKLRRKKSGPRKQRKNPRHVGFAIKPVGPGKYYGFMLDGNGRYLMADCTVTHNTWIMIAILLYRVVLTTLLRNPQNFFGISRGSNIIYNVLSVTRETVRQTAFGDAINFMQTSPYFLEDLKFDPEMEYSKSIVPFRNNIYLTAGSKGWHVLGRNVLGVGLDEGNFRLEQDPDRKAYALYDQVRTRIANRFQKSEGFLPAISIIASSASDESSFTETIIREIERANSPATQAVYRQPVYKIKRHELKLGRSWFKVAHGLRNTDPFILNGWYLEDGTPIAERGPHEEPPKGAKVELVPEMYWPDFRRNCRINLQSVSGISTGGSHRLFSSMIDVERCLELSEKEGLRSPLKANVRTISVSVEDDLNIWDYLEHSVFATRQASRIVPVRHPTRLRYVHLDLATTSKAGLAVCHLGGNRRVEGVVRGGLPFDEYRLLVEYDFILTITAGQSKPIHFDKINRFLFWLRDMCGFRFGLVTADWFQSEMPLQQLEAGGFKVGKLSIDRDKAAYVAWRTGFEDHRIRLYRSEEMLEEAEKLMESDKKFDHPDNGSKDTTDACAGAYFNAVNSEERTALLTESVPSLYQSGAQEAAQAQQDPLAASFALPLPSRTYRSAKVHRLK